MDALGHRLGCNYFAYNINERSYAVYDDTSMAQDIKRAVEKIQSDGATKLLTVSDALRMVTDQSLLIMVDHSKTALTLSNDL